MPRPHPVPEALTGAAFTRDRGLQLVSAKRLRGPAFDRLHRGVYIAAGRRLDASDRIRAARLALPADAVLVGRSAATAHGLVDPWDEEPVEVVCPTGRVRSRPGVRVRGDQLPVGQITSTPLGPATSIERTAFDLARRAALPTPAARALLRRLVHPALLGPEPPRGPAAFGFPDPAQLSGETAQAVARRLVSTVATVDRLLHVTGCPFHLPREVATGQPGLRGAISARVVLALADGRAESPPESVLRCRFVLAGLPAPEPQYEIWEAGRFIARPDLSWTHLRLSAEYDGTYHDEGDVQPSKDRGRDVDVHGVGWELLHYDRFHLRDVLSLLTRTHRVMVRRAAELR